MSDCRRVQGLSCSEAKKKAEARETAQGKVMTMEQNSVCRSFLSLYLDGKAERDMNEEDIAKALGYKSRVTLKSKRDNPLTLTIGDLLKLAELFNWSLADIVIVLRGGAN